MPTCPPTQPPARTVIRGTVLWQEDFTPAQLRGENPMPRRQELFYDPNQNRDHRPGHAGVAVQLCDSRGHGLRAARDRRQSHGLLAGRAGRGAHGDDGGVRLEDGLTLSPTGAMTRCTPTRTSPCPQGGALNGPYHFAGVLAAHDLSRRHSVCRAEHRPGLCHHHHGPEPGTLVLLGCRARGPALLRLAKMEVNPNVGRRMADVAASRVAIRRPWFLRNEKLAKRFIEMLFQH